MSYNSPNQRAPEMTPCTFCCEMEFFFTVALMPVTDITAIDFGLILHGIAQFKLIGDGRAGKVDDRAQPLVGLGLAMPLL